MTLPFANPAYLWLALLVPPLLAWWLRRRRGALRHPVVGELAGLPEGRTRLARWGPGLLRAAALLLLVVALAGPRRPDLRTRIDTEGVALVVLLDVSGSMAERDYDWQGRPITRMEAARRAFHRFVEGDDGADGGPAFAGRPTDLIGLVTFATRPETACPLTLSHSVLLRLLDAEKPRGLPGESETNISDAVALGLHQLRGAAPRRKVLVLLTDGDQTVPHPQSGWSRLYAAQVAHGLGIPIYTIDAGGSGAPSPPTPLPQGERGERELPSPLRGRGVGGEGAASASPGEDRARAARILQEMARVSDGQYFQAHDTAALLRACKAIDALERSDIRSFRYRRYHEAYPWFALAAFALYAAALTLERTVWRRLP